LGAFPLNYPNSWDQLRNRTGSGIWLHGVPRHTFSRTPRSSEGCVTLANNDIETLRRFIVPHQTPVLLASQIRWQPALKSVGERQLLSALVEQWQRQWAARNLTGFLDFYRDHALIEGQPKGIWSQQLARSLQNPAPLSIKISELDLWVYPDEKNLVMAQFKQHYQNGNIQTVTRRQQYWQFAGGNWKIVREQTL
jgi:murein L,D-transpeptidase YafK